MFKIIESDLQSVLDISLNLSTLSSPRDFSDLKNYIDRAGQGYQSKTKSDDFKQLILFAQYDRRYLRAVSKTSPKLDDIQLQNHNLPMVLLFREALKITKNDKKSAVGLLDEAIRIPLGWVKSIPKDLLPSSLALENFLLPGNKEDGSDKSSDTKNEIMKDDEAARTGAKCFVISSSLPPSAARTTQWNGKASVI